MNAQKKVTSSGKIEKSIEKQIEKQVSLNSMSSPQKSARSNNALFGVKSGENANPFLNNLFSGIKGTVNRKDAEIVG